MTPVSKNEAGELTFGLAERTLNDELLEELANLTGGKYYLIETVDMFDFLVEKMEQTISSKNVNDKKTVMNPYQLEILLEVAKKTWIP